MAHSLFTATRGDWAKAQFPNRPISARVCLDGMRMLRDDMGNHISEQLYGVVTMTPDYIEHDHLSGVTYETAKFNAECITGTFKS